MKGKQDRSRNESGTNRAMRISGPRDFASTFGVPRETVEKLEAYAVLLANWQEAVNLVAPSTIDQIWHRHFADSAQILSHAQDAKCWLDLGSGAGFPGLVIAILLANHEDHVVHLIESNGRKSAFLSEVVRRTGAPAVVHARRIEEIASENSVPTVDVVTSRALAPLNSLLGLACGFFGENTVGLFLKGRDAEQEIGEAAKHWVFEYGCMPSRTSGDGRIVEIRKLVLRNSVTEIDSTISEGD
ncbi:MAG: 16S rRNA (guanine(527)-N(7))-methyltransferase RsmG [Rhodomicrobiaceae bacterium]